jgi:F-type H+-transporting ATPase subunit a
VVSSTAVGFVASDFPPDVGEFFTPALFGADGWLTKFTLFLWIGTAPDHRVLPGGVPEPEARAEQEPVDGRVGVRFRARRHRDAMIGHDGVKFAPYFATLFSFILLTNLWAIIPLVQISPNSHIAFPVILALISYFLFIVVGVRKHGFFKWFKITVVPSAPWYILPLVVPIEFFSSLIVRPITLSVRLFANMFAGHMILLVFTLGGFALFGAQTFLLKPVGILSWVMAIALTFLEALVILLQAYVFVVLTASYISGALAEEH